MLKKCYRLRKNEDFRKVYEKGNSVATRTLVLYWDRSIHSEGPRLGVSASKRIGNAVVRNRIRRRLKALMSPLLMEMDPSLDLVIIARKPIVDTDHLILKKDLEKALRKAALMGK